MRTAITVAVALCVGAMAGAVGVRSVLIERVDKMAAEAARLRVERDRVLEIARTAENRVTRLDAERGVLSEEVADWQARQMQRQAAEVDMDAALAPVAELEPEMVPDTADAAGELGKRRGAWGGARGTPEEEAERAQRRTEFMEEARTRYGDFISDEMGRDSDPATHERLVSLESYRNESMALMMELRNAQTDEERELVLEDVREVRRASRELVEEQRAHMIEGLAKEFGINAPQKQQAFNAALTNTLASPFFSSPDRLSTGGFGMGRGRGGGRPGR